MAPYDPVQIPTSLEALETLHRTPGQGDAPGGVRKGRPVQLLPFVEDRDLEQVYHLYREVFGEPWSSDFQARWEWAHRQCLHPQSNFKWVLIDNARVVGFLATTPLLYHIEGATVLAHTPCDYMVHPDYRFYGIRLMQEFFRTCKNCVTCDDIPATIKVTQWLGAHRLGMLARYVKLLDLRALRSRNALLDVPFLWQSLNLALPWIDRFRYCGARLGVQVQPVNGFDARFERFYHRLSGLVPVMLVKDLQFLEWRYGPNSPQASREIGVLTDQKGELAGYVVFYLSQRPHHAGYVLDLQTLPPHSEETASQLLAYAVERLRARRAWVVRYHYYNSPYNLPCRVLRRHGFIHRGGRQFLVKVEDSKWAAIAQSWQNWGYSYGDSEASYAAM